MVDGTIGPEDRRACRPILVHCLNSEAPPSMKPYYGSSLCWVS